MELIAQANAEAHQRLLAGEPTLVDVRPAGEVIDGLEEGVILHAGPPISWERIATMRPTSP